MEHKAGPRQLRRLLEAVLTIGSELDLHTVLETIIATAAELVDANYGALGVLDESGERLSDFITVGIDDAGRQAIGHLPEGHGILGLLIVDPQPLRLPDLREHPDSYGFPPNHPPMRSFLGVPITVRGTVFGNLYLCDKRGGDVFTDIDEELVVDLAAAAAIAIQNARAHALTAELATLADRERIARDLHDVVIQRLFAIGLGLNATMHRVSDDDVRERLDAAVDGLDETVRDIRAAIFQLHTIRAPGRSVRAELAALVDEAAALLGFSPTIRFDGPIDAAVDHELAEDMLAVTREALSNVARHPRATSVDIEIDLRDSSLHLRVVDNGVGVDVIAHRSGLANLRTRADRRDGEFTVGAGPQSGTELIWQVPLKMPSIEH